MIRFSTIAAMLVPTLISAGTASAHVGFLLPNSFAPEAGQEVTVIAAFTDSFPNPEIALRSDGFALVAPDGDERRLEPQAVISSMSVLVATPHAPGTYRITTGERLGRKGEVAIIGGSYVRIGDGGVARDEVPADAAILTSQTATVSEVLVTVPGGGASVPAGAGRLRLVPTEGPGAMAPGEPVSVSVLFDAAPLKGAEVSLIAAFGHYETPEGTAYAAGDDGLVQLPGLDAGVYALMVRHIAPAPAGADTDVRSYTTALTLEVRPR